MNSNEYSRKLTRGTIAHVEGESVAFDGSVHVNNGALFIDDVNFLPQEIDYTDEVSLELLATSAIHTADGFYNLIKSNCCTENPDISYDAHLEMYLALSGLACEIYMKAILYYKKMNQGRKLKVHKLDELFSQLPLEIRNDMESKIHNITSILPEIKDMFTMLRYDFEHNNIEGKYFIIFKFMEELKTVTHTYPLIKSGAIKYANGNLTIE